MKFNQIYKEASSVLKNFDYSDFCGETYSYEFEIVGEGSGKFYMLVKDGIAEIEPFDYKNSSCRISASSNTLRQIFQHKLTPTAAYSTGRLKIKGNVSAAFKLADKLCLTL